MTPELNVPAYKQTTNVLASMGENASDGGNMDGVVTPPDTPVVDTGALAEQADINLPDVPVDTPKTASAGAFVEGTGDTMMSDLEAEQTRAKEEAEKGKETTFDDLTKAMAEQTGLSGFLAIEEEKRDVQGLAGEVATQIGIIRSERLARAEYQTRLQQQGGGLKIGAQAEINNFNRDSLFKETNAVIQMGVWSDKLAAAEKAAMRMAEAFYEQEQNELAAKRFAYEENKELFNKAEQREFDIKYDQAKRELDRLEEQMKLTQQTKLDAMKMLAVNQDQLSPDTYRALQVGLSEARTPEEVLEVAGQYGVVDMLERNLTKLNVAITRQKYNDMINALNNPDVIDPETREKIGKDKNTRLAMAQIGLVSELYELRSIINEHGTVNPLDREAAARIATLRSSLKLGIAAAFDQGAISKDDSVLYEELLGKKWGTQTGLAGLDEAVGSMNRLISNNIETVEATYPDAVNFEPFKEHLQSVEAADYVRQSLGNQELTDEQAIDIYVDWVKKGKFATNPLSSTGFEAGKQVVNFLADTITE